MKRFLQTLDLIRALYLIPLILVTYPIGLTVGGLIVGFRAGYNLRGR